MALETGLPLDQTDQKTSWPTLLANFVGRVDGAAALLSTEHDRPAVSRTRKGHVVVRSGTLWGQTILNAAFDRLSEVVTVFNDPAHSKVRSEAIDSAVFRTLAGLTPTQHELLQLRERDRTAAVRQLVRQLAVARQQVRLAAETAVKAEPVDEARESAEAAQAQLLERSGGTLSLTEAADKLAISRQAMHKKVHAGNALGMMQNGLIVVPKLQFEDDNGKSAIYAGIDRVTKAFKDSKAGPFSALQFLTDVAPGLAERPIDALKKGKVEAVEQAARAYLSLDEG